MLTLPAFLSDLAGLPSPLRLSDSPSTSPPVPGDRPAPASRPNPTTTGAPMKVRSSIKRRTLDCQIVIRKGKRFVINKKNPRLKQRQG